MGIYIFGGGGGSTGVENFAVTQGRLTLTTGVPVTTADVTAATTLYFTPYNGDLIGLYDGAAWSIEAFTERSIAIPGTTDTNYDVFLYDNAGTLTLSLTAWTNATTRATALTTQNGVYVKTGATDYRYLGTVRTTDASGECEDSVSQRFVWNGSNRVSRVLQVLEATNSWSYQVAAWRAANNSTSNRVGLVIGLAESPIVAHVSCRVSLSNTHNGNVGIGIDSTAANSAQLIIDSSSSDDISLNTTADYVGIVGIGYHYIQWLEYCRVIVAASTFYGNAGVANNQSGMLAMTEG